MNGSISLSLAKSSHKPYKDLKPPKALSAFQDSEEGLLISPRCEVSKVSVAISNIITFDFVYKFCLSVLLGHNMFVLL